MVLGYSVALAQAPQTVQVENDATLDGPLIYEMTASSTGGPPTYSIATTYKVGVTYFVLYDWRANPGVDESSLIAKSGNTSIKKIDPTTMTYPKTVGACSVNGAINQPTGTAQKRMMSAVSFDSPGNWELTLKRDRIDGYYTAQPTPPPNSVIKRYNLVAAPSPNKVVKFTVGP